MERKNQWMKMGLMINKRTLKLLVYFFLILLKNYIS